MHSSHVAIHAATEDKRKKQEEEEKMTNYSREELGGEWEFKIVRSTFGAFRKPQVLQALIEEEAQAGWEMVEKFDEYRVRFKRSTRARINDAMLPDYYDPYRTQYGGLGGWNTMVMVGIGLAVLLLAGVLFFFLTL
jgi:hypothetical protein